MRNGIYNIVRACMVAMDLWSPQPFGPWSFSELIFIDPGTHTLYITTELTVYGLVVIFDLCSNAYKRRSGKSI